ncbi:hypothetical protein ABD81_03385 [Bacillus thuringiensis]|uniref:Uncharacterized protein n=1 Tax=Bacillus wiedmannii TaxID=1890302 RepID=A0A242ZKE6_9BACI|nr:MULTISPECIES: ETX/MTX2 family pore-forming toxin [Bacillus cereus group]MBG9749678.1 hypothetical protein [Bacillus thuringiensis]MBG9776834.1 hypothetical protein [Bacillus thuringiensis]MBG9923744.1 hypothetical protein [Bacillus thuringiensis]OTX93291.1 hypothetical protein BK730_06810 [Bacillus wiedmannii]OTZ91236.1 hypothetical protein BK771_03370 [Bacillus thuringiensis serovar ostriniae]
MKKAIFSLLATTMSLGMILSPVPQNVKAAEQSKISVYQDLGERVKKMAQSAALSGSAYGHHTIRDAELTGRNIESSMTENSELLTIGENILENNLGHDATLPTSGYEHFFEDKTSTTNTTGWTFGYNFSATLSVLMASATHNFSVDYNMTTARTEEKTQRRTFTLPSQPVPVPAGKTYKVEYKFEKVSISGRNQLNANLYGDVTYYYNNQPLSPQLLYSALGRAADTQGFERIIRDTVSGNDRFGIRATGIGLFKTEFGTRLFASITDITNPRSPVKIETKTIPVEFKTISENTRVVE